MDPYFRRDSFIEVLLGGSPFVPHQFYTGFVENPSTISNQNITPFDTYLHPSNENRTQLSKSYFPLKPQPESIKVEKNIYSPEHEGSETLENLSLVTKRYKQPLSVEAVNLTIGPWIANPNNGKEYNIEIRFLFGRRKIKYEVKPVGKIKSSFVIEFPFTSVTHLQIQPNEKIIILQLSKKPNFSAREHGRCYKISDFTKVIARTFSTHFIQIAEKSPFMENLEKLVYCDSRLTKVFNTKPISTESTFDHTGVDEAPENKSLCDWDNENLAVLFCKDCKANYCITCDSVIHRHSDKKSHQRMNAIDSKNTRLTKKRKLIDICRCGSGISEYGDTCVVNRCPCFSSGAGCNDSCKCTSCFNPLSDKTLTFKVLPDISL